MWLFTIRAHDVWSRRPVWAPQMPSDLVPDLPLWGIPKLTKEELNVGIAGETRHILFTQPLTQR